MVAAETPERVRQMANAIGEVRDHLVGRSVWLHVHDFHLADEVFRRVEYVVEVSRQRVEVLGVEWRRERVPQGPPKFALGVIGAMFAVADGLRRGGVAV